LIQEDYESTDTRKIALSKKIHYQLNIHLCFKPAKRP